MKPFLKVTVVTGGYIAALLVAHRPLLPSASPQAAPTSRHQAACTHLGMRSASSLYSGCSLSRRQAPRSSFSDPTVTSGEYSRHWVSPWRSRVLWQQSSTLSVGMRPLHPSRHEPDSPCSGSSFHHSSHSLFSCAQSSHRTAPLDWRFSRQP